MSAVATAPSKWDLLLTLAFAIAHWEQCTGGGDSDILCDEVNSRKFRGRLFRSPSSAVANETLDEDDAGDGVLRELAPNAGEGLREWYRESGVECAVDGVSRDI